MNKRVYVAVSGGVDSSVSLALLRDKGFDVTGVYFKTYKPDGDITYCRQQGLDAQKVCKTLGVPFKVFDLQDEYRRQVFDYMINGYKSGQTPNPDMICNKEIKFGVFARKAFEDGADLIATGHYARLRINQNDVLLMQPEDLRKDQTYFLSQVNKEVLSKVIFPLGDYTKRQVRYLARDYNLHTAEKKDSQGICFIGREMNVHSFLQTYIPKNKGYVLNLQGDIVGEHFGANLITIGQRRGFTIYPKYQIPNMPRLFVISKDIYKNTITVGTKEEFEYMQSLNRSLVIEDLNWISNPPDEKRKYRCRIRHRGKMYDCSVKFLSDCDALNRQNMQIDFQDIPYAPATGQFVAIYDNNICLGGGVIARCLNS